MEKEQQLKLQAFVDGELSGKAFREVASWTASDARAAGLVQELRQTCGALEGFESGVKVPDSREFYWSGIEREIRRLGESRRGVRARGGTLWLRRFLLPAGAVAALIILGTLAAFESGLFGSSRPFATEMTVADAGTFTYHDYANGTTLVWLTYPAER